MAAKQTKPLSFAEANEYATAHLHLIGTNFTVASETYIIDHICVAPYDEMGRHLFLLSYEEKGDPQLALKACMSREYDVMIIGSNAKSNKTITLSLSTHMNKH